ncbi:Porin [Marinibacterium anthonyi]|nr:porin [Paracoccaceae bacterium]QEW18134.1 Porin [Marinibacterium anthonyi]
MKKTLLTSTALVLMAGAAAAQVSFSGYGRFGLGYNEARGDAGGEDTALVSRFRLNIDGKAVTDAGVEFSARVRLQADDDPYNNEQKAAGLNGARYSVIYGGLRVDAGNVAGSFDNLANYYGYEPGLEAFTGQYVGQDYSFLAYDSTGAGGNAVYVSYTAAGFTFGASYNPEVQADNDQWDIGASYVFNNFTVAAAYGESDQMDQSTYVFTLGADFDRFSGTLFIGDEDNVTSDGTVGGYDVSGTFWGASLSFDVGAATSILASYGAGDNDNDTESYGVSAIHDLGGGVSLRGGIGWTDSGEEGVSRADGVVGDFGVLFNF